MSAQFDVLPGFDLSSVTNPTRTQHIQAISQIAPLSNIGGVIFQAGPSLAPALPQGIAGAPDVTNNPRFARYVWLNTFNSGAAQPSPYYYDASTGQWRSTSVAAGSITNIEISATAEIDVSKLKDGNANEVIVTAADGITVQWSSVSSLLAALNDSVPLTAIDDSAAVGAESFLRRVGSTAVWKTFAETVTAIQNALSGVAPSVFTPGANNTILGTSGAGVVAFNTPANILANHSLPLALLDTAGASTSDLIKFDGSNFIRVTPGLKIVDGNSINNGSTPQVMGAAAVFTIPHGLTVVPKLVRVVAVNQSADVGFVAGDELDVFSIRDSGTGNVAVGVSCDTSNIVVTFLSAAGNAIPNKGTGAYAAMTEASWSLKAYAWK